MLSWNVNGIRAALRKGFLDWLTGQGPDILCLQETRAAVDQLPPELLHVPGYHAYFSEPARRGYSGVALYTRTEPRSIAFGMGSERFDPEGRTILADYGSFLLCNVYFPNGKASGERLAFKMDFYEAFRDFLSGVGERDVVVCGDVNTAHREIDLARPRENAAVSGFLPRERAWIDRLIAAGFVDSFRLKNQEPGRYTWWDLKTRARETQKGDRK